MQQYVAGDHLGTTSLVLNANGTVHSEARHYPDGQERWRSGTLPTDYRFTGQRYDSYIQLTRMGARWYDGAMNSASQATGATIIYQWRENGVTNRWIAAR